MRAALPPLLCLLVAACGAGGMSGELSRAPSDVDARDGTDAGTTGGGGDTTGGTTAAQQVVPTTGGGVAPPPVTGGATTTGGTTGGDGDTTDPSCTPDTFANFGQQFLADHCASCHGSEFGTFARVRSEEMQMSMRIAGGNMPPAPAMLSPADSTRIRTWLGCIR